MQDWQLDDAWQAEARKCGLATVNDGRWSVESSTGEAQDYARNKR